MAYFADWAPREDIDFSRFDWIDYAFDVVSQDSSLNWDDAMNGSKQLQKLVADAHGGGTKVKLSIGGWTGSKDFSTAVSTPEKRQTFANNVEKLYKDYNLDGIDIDWEYPGQSGDGANGVSPNDTQNMLSFFKLLREALPPTARITAAVQDQPFAGADGQPIHDASGFAEVLDWVLMMDYDTYETTTPPGPNAPLYNGCGKSREPSQNAAAGVNAWTAAGFPANKLVLGVPSYGYITKSSETTLQARSLPPTRHSPRRLSRRNTALPEDDSGQIQFRSLVRQGILVQGGDGSFVGSGGFERGWDSCSATPFLHNPQSGQLIPYDDPQSLALKAAFVRKMGMAGVNLFDIHGDTDAWDLTDSLRKNLVVPAV
ncbi:glycoside hydrolase family 18 protein [Leucogyrophana mollusca]|uniref:Glycoside hydrolase family 18 protein n=1 Tax=Leucogyrophana mollusca TaxID=85980 RepID=A0ACB8C0F4_9AGAM|nr:glycoside hydrolase family 18 protein [Leucogyrophana mollusca]